MPLRDIPIRRKLMRIMLLTSGLVLLLTCVAFLAYEFLTFRQTSARQLTTLGEIIASNSTAALAFKNPDDARETLAALRAEPNIVAATLYDENNQPFAFYPESLSAGRIPSRPEADGYRFQGGRLIGFEPVVERDRRLGTLYLESDMGALYQRLGLYGGIALLVFCLSLLIAYLLSRKLQQQISNPILQLAAVANAVSERRDYSVRAPGLGRDEIGRLTDAFNHMLGQIGEQNAALKESESQNRAVVDSALDAIVSMNHDGVLAGFNPAAERIFGHRADDVLGRPLADVIIPPEMRELHRQGLARYLATGEGPVLGQRIELTGQRADGSMVPLEVSITRMPGAGAPRFTGFLRDITEQKHADARIHAQLARHDLLNRITRAIGDRQDLSSIFDVVLHSLEENFPIDFGCICLHDPVRDWLTIASLGRKGEALAMHLDLDDQAGFAIDGNGLSRCVQGHLVYEPDTRKVASPFAGRLAAQGLRSLVAAPLLLESRIFGILIAARREPETFTSMDCDFLRQLSEHVALAAHQAQINTALQQAYDDLRQSQQAVLQQERLRALGEMASGIAHDINNAISPVMLYTQSLLESEPNLSASAREYLETIERAIEDVAETVARMREFYRQRQPQLTLTPADMNSLVRQVLNLTQARWRDMAQQRGVMIETKLELAPDLPQIVAAESEIREALTNLVFNAVDAMPQGGTLTIRTAVARENRQSGEDGRPSQVYVEVSDTGVGMDEATRERCLEPFYTTKGERGTGLGLAMVYGVVQRHSADIAIESTLGQGTTVRLSFSVQTGVSPDAATAEPYVVPSRLRVLVVDDDPLLLKSLRDTLETDGHVVTTAKGGQEGIDTFRATSDTERFDAVITDLGMPHVDGRQVARSIKETSPATPVIMLTGWGQRLLADGDVPNHVDRLLSKPPRLRELREALAQCLRA